MTRLTNEEKLLLEEKSVSRAIQIGYLKKELMRYCNKNRKDLIGAEKLILGTKDILEIERYKSTIVSYEAYLYFKNKLTRIEEANV